MATAATDQRRSLLVAATFFVVAFAIVAGRFISNTKLLQHSSPPLTDLESLRPYLAPLSDSGTVGADSAVTVASRDPFASTVAAPTLSVSAKVKPARAATQRNPWVVTTILLEGTRKSAIVNDRWVNVGDALADGSRLTAVERDRVIVTDARGVRHTITISHSQP